ATTAPYTLSLHDALPISTSHNNSTATTAAVSQVSITSLSLPAPQQAADIGAPAIKGSTTYRQGVYSVHAGGADIWGTSDQFQFRSEEHTSELQSRSDLVC